MNSVDTSKQQELINWAIEKLNSYDKDKRLYNIGAIILSILDVVCGIIAIFSASMLVTSVVASILCGTAWAARTIQLIKCEKLAKALKVLSASSIAYIAVRKKRGEFMKNIKIRNIIIAVLTVLGFASVIVCYFVPALKEYVNYAIYVLCAILPADLYAVFNNAKLNAEEIQANVEKKIEKEAEKEIKSAQKQEQLTQAQQEKAQAKADAKQKEAEEKAKNDAEFRLKVEAAKARILQKRAEEARLKEQEQANK